MGDVDEGVAVVPPFGGRAFEFFVFPSNGVSCVIQYNKTAPSARPSQNAEKRFTVCGDEVSTSLPTLNVSLGIDKNLNSASPNPTDQLLRQG